MIRVFLEKDWRRVRRDPLTIILLLLLPVMIALITRSVFSSGSRPVQFVVPMALVDEDRTPLTGFLDGALSNEQVKQIFDVRKLDRQQAMAAIQDNQLAGALIVPKGFTEAYLHQQPCELLLITNPARPVSSNILNQTFSILTDLLDTVRELFPDLLRLTDTDKPANAFHLLGDAADRIADLSPILFQLPFSVESAPSTETKTDAPSAGIVMTLAFIPGLGFMVGLFIVSSVFRRFSEELFRGVVHRMLISPVPSRTVLAALMVYACLLVMTMQAVLWLITVPLFRIPVYHPQLLVLGLLQMGLLATVLNGFLYALPIKHRAVEALTSVVTMLVCLFSGLLVSPLFMPVGIRSLVSHSPFYRPVESMINACLKEAPAMNWGREFIVLAVLMVLMLLAGALFHWKMARVLAGEKLGEAS